MTLQERHTGVTAAVVCPSMSVDPPLIDPHDVECHLDADPLRQLSVWLDEAAQAGLREPSAMALATVGRDGDPQVRMVLLRGLDERGLVFYTNLESDKGIALAAHPRGAVCFYWDPLGRQVRVSGAVEPISREESAAYFATRPVGSRRAAWASDQSRAIGDRAALEARFAEAERRFATGGVAHEEIPLPPFWGGYRIRPERCEFWIGRPDRLHDRILYTLEPDGGWQRRRLMP